MENFEGGNFDGYRFFKYLTEDILTNGQCLLPNAGLNFDSLAGKCQKCQNFPLYGNSRISAFVY